MGRNSTLVPVTAAKQLSREHNLQMVIILGFDTQEELIRVTTYGQEPEHKVAAEHFSERCIEVLAPSATEKRIHETYRSDPDGQMPAKYRRALELLVGVYTTGHVEPDILREFLTETEAFSL